MQELSNTEIKYSVIWFSYQWLKHYTSEALHLYLRYLKWKYISSLVSYPPPCWNELEYLWHPQFQFQKFCAKISKLHLTKNLLVTHCSTIWSKNLHNLQMMNTTCLRNLSNLVKPAFEAYWLKKTPKPVSASCSLNNSLAGLSLSYELNKKVWSCPTFKKRPFDPLYCSALNH